MKELGKVVVAMILGLVVLSAGGSGNKQWLIEHSEDKWRAQGFEVVDYEGYQFAFGILGTKYGGARVWHRLRKVPDNGITYSGSLYRWGDEIHVYGPTAVEAIEPSRGN